MKRSALMLCLVLLIVALPLTACGGKSRKGDGNMIPHTNYGGCRIQGRHYHNTHVFIGDQYNASLSEWLKY
jgi:hypothetical protein